MQRGARRVGLSVARHPPPDSLAAHLVRLLDTLEVDAVLDVGAHEGGYARFLRDDVGYAGDIVSFEPSPDSHAALAAASARDPRWHTLGLALGSDSGEATLHRYAGGVLDSLLEPSAFGTQRYRKFASDRGAVPVEVRRLDEVFDAVTPAGTRRALLKSDTQGFDLEVVAGARGVLDVVAAVQVETAVQPLYAGAPRLPDVIVALEDLGYALTGVFPVSRDTDALRLVTVDCVFRRVADPGAG